MSFFNAAFDIVMKNEGGYVNNPKDKGGETYKGIARNYFSGWKGWPIIDKIKATRTIKTGEIINDASLNQLVRDFYFANKWQPRLLDSINDFGNATLLFDMSTQHGNWGRVANIGLFGMPASNNWLDSKVANSLTADSIKAINSKPKESYDKIAKARMQYVQHLADANLLDASLVSQVKARVANFINNYFKFSWSTAGTSTVAIFLIIAGLFF